ncbi:Pectate lyase, N-terminal, partial [Dillenia turbinata]
MAGMSFHYSSCFFLLLFILVQANIGQFDEYWMRRAEKAWKAAMKAFNPNPEEATFRFNAHVAKMINSTRRNLTVNKEGECVATNPIDRCWRCDKDWEKNRRKLADCVLGLGRKTVGGKHGRTYVLTSAADDDLGNPKPGTLCHAVIQKEPLWIVFAKSMIIQLKQELMMTSDKTIDGRGKNVHITKGAGKPTIISHGNRFVAPQNDAAREVTKREYAQESEWKNWQWTSENDEMKNGAFFVQSGNSRPLPTADMIKANPGSWVTRLIRFS